MNPTHAETRAIDTLITILTERKIFVTLEFLTPYRIMESSSYLGTFGRIEVRQSFAHESELIFYIFGEKVGVYPDPTPTSVISLLRSYL